MSTKYNLRRRRNGRRQGQKRQPLLSKNSNHEQIMFTSKTPSYMRPSLIRSPRVVHKLDYKSDLTTLSAGATFLVKSFVANALYDPDPAILSTSYAGFSYYAEAYEEYLVQISKVRWGVCNLVSTPIACAIVYTFEQLDSTLSTWQAVRDAAENSFSTVPKTLNSKGEYGAKVVLHAKCVLQDLLKRGVYQVSELYSGGYNTNPTVPVYVNFLLWSLDGSTNLTAGVVNDITLTATSEFFAVRPLRDTLTRFEEPQTKQSPNGTISFYPYTNVLI